LRSILLYVLLLVTTLGFSKFSHQDNLRFLVASNSNSEKIDAYLNIIKGVVKKMPDTAIIYINKLDQLLVLEELILSDNDKSSLQFYKGVYHYKKGNYLRAINPIEASLNDNPGDTLKGKKYFYLGLSHKLLGNYSQATENFIHAIKKYEAKGNHYAVLNIYINLGNVCGQVGNHSKGLEYFSKALELAKITENESLNRVIYNNMGNAFQALEDYELALSNFKASYEGALESKNKKGQFLTLINIANAKQKLNRHDEALGHLTKALRLADTLNNHNSKAAVFFELGSFFTDLKNTKQAKFYLGKAFVIADTLQNYPHLQVIYESYRKLYKSKGNYKKAFFYYEKYEEIKDFISTRENQLKVTQLYSEFEFEKKEQQLALLEQKTQIEIQKNKIQQAELSEQVVKGERDSIFIYLLIGIGILLLVLAAGLGLITTLKHKKNGELNDFNIALEESKEEIEYQNTELEDVNANLGLINNELLDKNSEIESQKEELQSQRDLLNNTNSELKERNKDVTDSIHYAQKIQQAMLNSSFQIDEAGMEHFTFYKPRDIVSGDFYWGNKVDDKLIIAIGDCTGHGVPGAFMSCLGISLLNEIVFGRNIIQPHTILENLRNLVIQLIAADRNADLQIGDGMDISIVVIDLKTRKMEFSGAMNGVTIVSDGVMQEVKGDKSPIGQHIIQNHTFTLQEFQLKENDHIYMSTDGYKDQFGGPKNKKMGKRRMNEAFIEISSSPIPVQYSKIISLYKNWKTFEEQIDDVCLFGMKIK
jgi:serine phosphatase RsbU (regulator of sigma subunit)